MILFTFIMCVTNKEIVHTLNLTFNNIFEYEDKHHLITVDSYSGWYEIDYPKVIRCATVITKLKKIFITHGSPYNLTSDNGRQYTSEQF